MADNENKVFINGQIISAEKACISVFDRSFLYGDGVFETLRTYNDNIFLLDQHIERLYISAKLIRLEIPWSKEWIKEAALKTVIENKGLNDLILRITISRGVQKGGVLPEKNIVPTIVLTTREIEDGRIKDSWKVIISTIRRNDKRAIDPLAKSANFLNNILAGLEGQDAGADESLMLNIDEKVTEGTVSNVFIVKEDVIITPPITDGLLRGITRDQVILLAKRGSLALIEKSIKIDDLYGADEIFLTLSSQGIVPVTEIDRNMMTVGNITEKLISEYNKMTDE